MLEDCNILVNACMVPGIDGYHDGIRVGSTCITQYNIKEENVKLIASIIANILNEIKNKSVNYEENRIKVLGIVKEVFDNDSFR